MDLFLPWVNTYGGDIFSVGSCIKSQSQVTGLSFRMRAETDPFSKICSFRVPDDRRNPEIRQSNV